MSIHAKLGLAAVLFATSITLGAAQNAPLDIVRYPAAGGPSGGQQSVRAPLAPPSAGIGSARAPSEASGGPGGLAENAYDFTNPDSIPGFGTLPPNYDSSGVMPRIGSE